MKSASAGNQAHLGADTTWAFVWRLTAWDGTQIWFTEHDISLQVGAEIFEPRFSGTRSALRQSDKLRAEGMTAKLVLESSALAPQDFENGLWNRSVLEVYVTNHQNTADGLIQMGRIRLGEVTWGDNQAEVRGRSLASIMETTVGKTYKAGCQWHLGSAECGVRGIEAARPVPIWQATTPYTVRPVRDAKLGSVVQASDPSIRFWFKCIRAGTSLGSEPIWVQFDGGQTDEGGSPLGPLWEAFPYMATSGVVASVLDGPRSFTVSDLVEADGWWDFGLLTWTGSSANVKSRPMEVHNHTQLSPGGSIVLYDDMANDIEVGDTFTLVKGCDKKPATCKDPFDNNYNNGAWGKDLPGEEFMFTTPDAA